MKDWQTGILNKLTSDNNKTNYICIQAYLSFIEVMIPWISWWNCPGKILPLSTIRIGKLTLLV